MHEVDYPWMALNTARPSTDPQLAPNRSLNINYITQPVLCLATRTDFPFRLWAPTYGSTGTVSEIVYVYVISCNFPAICDPNGP